MAITTDMLNQYTGSNGRPVGHDYTSDVYGRVIPISQGRRVIEGAPIWASPLRNETVTVVGDNIPLGRVSYQKPSRDFAVAFGYNLAPTADHDVPVILRMWFNGALVYDQSDPLIRTAGIQWAFYDGTETQTADAAIVADQGDLAPAFRGLIYMVFKNYALPKVVVGGTDQGGVNRSAPAPTGDWPSGHWTFDYMIPQVRIELVDGLVIDPTPIEFGMLDGSTVDSRGLLIDWDAGILYGVSGHTTSDAQVLTFDLVAQQETTATDITGVAYTNLQGYQWAVGFDQHNKYVVVNGDGISNTAPIHIIDLATGQILDSLGEVNNDIVVQDDSVPFLEASDIAYLMDGGVERPVAMLGSFFNDWVAMAYDAATGTWQGSPLSCTRRYGGDLTCVQHYPCLELGGGFGGYQDGACIVANGTTVVMEYFGFREGSLTQLGQADVTTIPGGNLVQYMIVDPADKGIIILYSDLGGSNWRARKIFVFLGLLLSTPTDDVSSFLGFFPKANAPHQPSADAVLYDVAIPPMPSVSRSFLNAVKYSNYAGGTFGYPLGASIVILDLANGSTKTIPNGLSMTDFVWDSRVHGMYTTDGGTLVLVGVTQTTGEDKTIGDYLGWLAVRAGFDEADVYVDPALDDSVLGMLIDKQYATQTLFGDLGQLYDFSFFESDGKVKFVRAQRGSTEAEAVPAVFDLEIADLAIEGGLTGDDALITTFGEPAAVVGFVSLEYRDSTNLGALATKSYSLDAETSDETGTAVQELHVPVIMPPAEAYTRITKVAIVAQADNSVTQEFHLSQRYSQLEPSDVVAITKAPFRYLIRLDEVTFNGDFSISVLGYNHSTDNNITVPDEEQLGLPSDGQGFGLGDSKPLALDIPLITPGLDPGHETIVFETGVLSYGQTNFTSANLEHGPSPGGPFALLYNSETPVIAGNMSGTLADAPFPFCTDDVTTITVALRNGTSSSFDSTDRDGMLAGDNAILIGAAGRWELIYFRDVAVVNAKTVRLSGLLRGRRGTDPSIPLHAASDLAILVRSVAAGFAAPLQPQALPGALIDTTRRYVATGVPSSRGSQMADVVVVGASAMCWKPAQLAAVADGNDIDLSWLRRDRLGQEFVEVPQPMNEEAELYDLEILDGSTVVRTVAGLTVPAYTYLDADQVTDGFTPPQATLKIRVYQVSGLAGRGYPAEETLNVD